MSGPGDRDDETGEPADADDSFPDDTTPSPEEGSSPGREDPDADGSGGRRGDEQPPSRPCRDRYPREWSGGERQMPGHRDARSGDKSSTRRGGQIGYQPPEEEDDDSTWMLVSRDIVVTVLAVVLIGGYLFAISGVWPPMVAIESGSMEPNMNVNDMVFVMDADRFPPDAAHGSTGVVTAAAGAEHGYTQYGKPGDVIIFEPGGDENATPIIHRAMFWVEEGENWYDRANPSYVGSASSCAELASCPAPHDGFITKGDANSRYDQASIGNSNTPVKPDWIVGTSEVRIPRLGWFRLQF